MSRFALCFAFVLLHLPAAFAAPTIKVDAPLAIVTGPSTGTYIRFGQDISQVAKAQGLSIDVKESLGSVDNVRRLNSVENAGLAIVQSDLLGYLKRAEGGELSKLSQKLRMVFPFYREEVHLFARSNIQRAEDLNGKRVVVGDINSGHWLTSVNILTMLGVKPAEMLRLSPAEAVVAVLQNRADAMFFVGGKPVKLFQNLQDLRKHPDPAYVALLDQVHFVPLNDKRLLGEYATSGLTTTDYPFVSSPVPTVAVNAVLMSYDFSNAQDAYGKIRCDTIRKLTGGLRQALPTLQQSGHPKWKEVNLNDTSLGLWERDSCVANAGNGVQTASPATQSPLESELMNAVQKRW